MSKEFEAVITITWDGNNMEAETKEGYIQKLKESFFEAYQIELADSEIIEIREIENA